MSKPLTPGVGWVVAQMILLAVQLTYPLTAGLSFSGWSVWAGASVMTLAGTFALWALKTLGRSLTPLPKPKDDAVLVVAGPYRWVRHPIYSALLLVCGGWAVMWVSSILLALTATLFIIFLFKTQLEEQWLVLRYPEYEAYRKKTGRLIPRIFGR